MQKLWEYKKLGDVCTVERGGSPRPIDKFITNDENGINWIKIGDTSDSMYITSTAQRIMKEGMKKSRYVKPGDFLLSNSMSFGRPYILKIDGCIHDGWLVLRDEEKVFDKRFLYYYLSSKSTYKKFEAMAVGGVVNNLNSEMVRNTYVPIPNKDVQSKIANQFDMVRSILESRKKESLLLENLVRARFVELFGHPLNNTKGWIEQRLGECCVINPKKNKDNRLKEDLVVSFIPMASVSENGDILELEDKFYRDVKNGFTYFCDRDVLFAKITPCMENGKGAVAVGLKNGIGFGSTEFHVLRPIIDKSNSYWLHSLTSFEIFRKKAEENMTGSAGQKRVPASFLENIQVSVPPINIQNEFEKFVLQIDKSKVEVQRALDEAQLLFDSLMQKYFG